MMVNESVTALVQDLRRRTGAIAAAVVSRDGTVRCADLPAGVHAETFAILCATVVGAAATAALELGRAPPDRVVVEGSDTTTLIVATGSNALLVLTVESSTETSRVAIDVERFSAFLGPT